MPGSFTTRKDLEIDKEYKRKVEGKYRVLRYVNRFNIGLVACNVFEIVGIKEAYEILHDEELQQLKDVNFDVDDTLKKYQTREMF